MKKRIIISRNVKFGPNLYTQGKGIKEQYRNSELFGIEETRDENEEENRCENGTEEETTVKEKRGTS